MGLNMKEISLSEFADKINEIMPEIAKSFIRRQTNELFKGKITLPQLFILDLLNKKGASKMTDIAHFLNVTTSAATGIVDRLVKFGYVERVYEPLDRRIIKIKLTAKGAQLLSKINREKRQMIMDIFVKISQKEREDYLRILMRIREVLSKEEA
jgi:DNA-binding MarR family transcriptional regulator